MTIDDLALAYELRQEGCQWKVIAGALGGDAKLLAAQVARLVAFGIHRGPGRPSAYTERTLLAADAQHAAGIPWAEIGEALGIEPERIRQAWQYAKKHGLIEF
jgi:hypothetical protein